MTIDLGFAHFPGRTGEPIGVVDVPGHERFIRNMVAGAWGIDLGLLVVAVDDGWMPQTEDHFRVIQLLGIERIIVVARMARDGWGTGELKEQLAEDIQHYRERAEEIAARKMAAKEASEKYGVAIEDREMAMLTPNEQQQAKPAPEPMEDDDDGDIAALSEDRGPVHHCQIGEPERLPGHTANCFSQEQTLRRCRVMHSGRPWSSCPISSSSGSASSRRCTRS